MLPTDPACRRARCACPASAARTAYQRFAERPELAGRKTRRISGSWRVFRCRPTATRLAGATPKSRSGTMRATMIRARRTIIASAPVRGNTAWRPDAAGQASRARVPGSMPRRKSSSELRCGSIWNKPAVSRRTRASSRSLVRAGRRRSKVSERACAGSGRCRRGSRPIEKMDARCGADPSPAR